MVTRIANATEHKHPDSIPLSVVLVTPGGLKPIRQILLALEQQTAVSRLELIIIGPGPTSRKGFNPEHFRAAYWIPWSPAPLNLHRARAIGVEFSRGAMVTFAENHAFPDPGWAAAIITAQGMGWDGIGPVMVNANPGSTVSRAHLLLAHGPWLPPQHSGPRRSLPWHNSAYKTSLLRQFNHQLAHYLSVEGFLQAKLRQQGARFYLTAEAHVSHLNISRIQALIAEQITSGRLYGAARARRWSSLRRAVYILAAGLVPCVRLLRLQKQTPRIPGLPIAPLLTGIAAHTVGETIGYLLGAGQSVRRSGPYELAREKFVRTSDLIGLNPYEMPAGDRDVPGKSYKTGEKTDGNALAFPDTWKDALKRQLIRLPLPLPPLRLQIDVTDDCNFSCPDCLKWRAQSRRREMSTSQYQRFWPQLRHLILFKEVIFSGGEPLLREDLPTLISGAKQCGFHTTVATNGWLLEAKHFERLTQAGLDCILLSLNSLKDTCHDTSKGMPGSYSRVRAAMRLWRRAPRRPTLVLSTLITPDNVAELPDMVAFAHKQGASILFQAYCEPAAHYSFADQNSIPEKSIPGRSLSWSADTLADLGLTIDCLVRLKARGAPIRNAVAQLRRIHAFCHAPRSLHHLPCAGTHFRLFIDPAGHVRVCQGMKPIGNIRDQHPARLWWSPAARRARKMSRTCSHACRLLNNHW